MLGFTEHLRSRPQLHFRLAFVQNCHAVRFREGFVQYQALHHVGDASDIPRQVVEANFAVD